jgi:hypothetical protein
MTNITAIPPPSVACHLSMAWLHAGAVVLGEDGRLLFPEVGRTPGLYQITITMNGAREVYIGEAADIRRRFQNYRTPGPTQQTSQRINALLRKMLADGADVTISTAITASIDWGDGAEQADLTSKVTRCLIENAAIGFASRSAIHRIHNLAQPQR